METKHIQEFLALAEFGSSYAAAEKLFVSQSTLLRHVQALEEEFGVPFFDRTRRGFQLNLNGQLFRVYAEKMAVLHAQCCKALHNEGGESNTIRVSAECKIIDLMIDFKKAYPQYDINYQKTEDVDKKLQNGEIEVAFLSRMAAMPRNMTAIPFRKEEVLVMLYDTHPLAERESIHLEELRNEKFIYLCDDPIFEGAFAEMFGRIGFSQDVSVTVPVGADLTEMVSAELGITLIHGKAETAPEVPGIRLIPLEPRLEYDVCMYYRNDVPLSKAGHDFVNYVRKWSILHKDVNTTMLRRKPDQPENR